MKERSFKYCTVTDQETINLGRELGASLKEGDVIALAGELGSGKTCFTKGVALGLGVSPGIVVTSPSFSLVNEYEGRCSLFHIDCYRLESLSDFLSTGLDEYFYQSGVVAMEWADRWPEILPSWSVNIEFTIVDERSRNITLTGYHFRALEILRNVGKQLD